MAVVSIELILPDVTCTEKQNIILLKIRKIQTVEKGIDGNSI